MTVSTPSAIARRLDHLPLLPGVVVRMLSLDADSGTYFEDVLDLAQEDPLFAIEILRAANSGASAPSAPVLHLSEAIARLGTRWVMGMVSAVGVRRVFVPANRAQRFLWAHSLEVAAFARAIAQDSVEGGAEPEIAYLAGLLHDLGRFVMFEETPEVRATGSSRNGHSKPPHASRRAQYVVRR